MDNLNIDINGIIGTIDTVEPDKLLGFLCYTIEVRGGDIKATDIILDDTKTDLEKIEYLRPFAEAVKNNPAKKLIWI